MKWVIKSKHLNEEKKIIGLELQDADGSFDANVRWDGAMEIHIHSITEEYNQIADTIHTSDIDGLIAKLQGLKKVCVDYLDDWK
ncbi:hypothetical protein [Fictibacillus barbaricus]|jgi:hypothetical protein|uniref:Uncharacterized protein n=1 Tax=Fictibacillus barbaricus TaxID=182136 RepID=A0ABS2ZB90_9BACL|nr:hypothetical protein [Fictibacillus barbaricus]MBN3545452.1 hypothetical protein [Fictibacillus barbaricus]GGB53515.1 hypothetical protein GCM10007199_18980 [Fictibacillus barbaricus]